MTRLPSVQISRKEIEDISAHSRARARARGALIKSSCPCLLFLCTSQFHSRSSLWARLNFVQEIASARPNATYILPLLSLFFFPKVFIYFHVKQSQATILQKNLYHCLVQLDPICERIYRRKRAALSAGVKLFYYPLRGERRIKSGLYSFKRETRCEQRMPHSMDPFQHYLNDL